ncbi:MAG: U32 family peptidase [Clostridiales bacterium]|jgi:putative protease|nr:U32 family peptidase [Clostridiales bacterium]
MSEVEILAPVGGQEQLIAAVRCGANAVYLGIESFNARRNAENFDKHSLLQAVSYCHIRGVRVYVTLNILIFDTELSLLDEAITDIVNSGADGIIVQDLAVLNRIKQICPIMPVHASTQMAVHNIAGVKRLQKLGFSRVVLARELSLTEIELIKRNTDIELECFVHGAHCMSVSGLCYISSVFGGRSGNRGLCAQPCRLNFTAYGREYALSLKDMSYIEKVKELQNAGVTSLKIEGRMKAAEYVAAVVTEYKNALEGREIDYKMLRSAFSRGGFTDGYLTEKRDINMFGIRSKGDKTASLKVQKQLQNLYHKEKGTVPVNMKLEIRKRKPAVLTVSSNGKTAFATGEMPVEDERRTLECENAKRFLSKTGGTPFILSKSEIIIDDNLTISSADINALRRAALKSLEERLSETTKKAVNVPLPEIKTKKRNSTPKIRIRIENFSQLMDCIDAEFIYIPIDELIKNTEKAKALAGNIIAELPIFISPKEESRVLEKLAVCKKLGIKRGASGNIGGIELIKRAEMAVYGQSRLNITNTLSLTEYENMGLCDTEISFELTFGKINKLCGTLPRGIYGYGYLPVMNFRVCPIKPSLGCEKCDKRPILTDKNGVSFTLLCQDKRNFTLLNSVPLYIADKKLPNIDFITLYFTFEDKKRAAEIYNMYKNNFYYDGNKTRGLYFREI